MSSPPAAPASLPPGFVSLPTYSPGVAISGAQTGVLGPSGLFAFCHVASGVRLVLFDAPGPLVSATIVVGTQPISNAGHPHTLEHIIFLGSHNHPARGYLDNLACRCLADGTNAWTEVEFTAYTAKTAGFEGFAHLLPVFLDHILRPKINAASFDSEVYHVREDGKEAGVVFCEMQARENTEADLCDRALRHALYEGTPLALESGGLCKEIRTLCNEDIARFHFDQYCGGNVTVIVGGSAIDPTALLTCVQPLLDEIAAQPGYEPGEPQWGVPLQLKPLPPVSRRHVNFPCPDEDIGTVTLSWRGPGITEQETCAAIEVLLTFLEADVWSPLRQQFVETEDQLASDVNSGMDVFLEVSAFNISFSGVEHRAEDDDDDTDEAEDNSEAHPDGESVETMEDDEESFLTSGKVEQLVMKCLSGIVEKRELPGGVNAIRAAIKREREYAVSELESASHSTVPHFLLDEVVYGHRESLMIGRLIRGSLETYAMLERKDENYWIDLLASMFVNASRVEVVMVPDAQLANKLAEEEDTAHAKRVTRLGQDTLARLGRESKTRISSLESHKFAADVFPPLPSTMNISRWPYAVSREMSPEYASQSLVIETNFVHCTMFIDTTSMPAGQRIFLPVLCELLPSCDILLEDGSYTPYTDHAKSVSEWTVPEGSSRIQMGYNGDIAHHCVVIHFAANPSSFANAAQLLFQTLFQSEVTVERLAAIAQTLDANATEDMRDADSVLGSAITIIPFLEAGSDWTEPIPSYALSNFLGSHPLVSFLSDEFTRKKPRKQVQRKILRKLNESLDALRALPESELFIQVSAKDPKPVHDILSSLWAKNRKMSQGNGKVVGPVARTVPGGELPISRSVIGELGNLLKGRSVGKVIGIPGVESCCFDVRVDSPVYVGHGDWFALSVCMEMLCRLEGPLWNAVRGAGLAYGVELANASWKGQMSASVYECATPAAAWDALCACLEDFRKALDQTPEESGLAVDLETAKASKLFTLNSGRSTPDSIAEGAISSAARGAPASPLADRTLEEGVENVTLGSVAYVFDKHVSRFCKAESRLVVVTCGQGAVQDTIEAFKKCSRPIHLEECSIDSLHLAEVDDVVESLKP